MKSRFITSVSSIFEWLYRRPKTPLHVVLCRVRPVSLHALNWLCANVSFTDFWVLWMKPNNTYNSPIPTTPRNNEMNRSRFATKPFGSESSPYFSLTSYIFLIPQWASVFLFRKLQRNTLTPFRRSTQFPFTTRQYQLPREIWRSIKVAPRPSPSGSIHLHISLWLHSSFWFLNERAYFSSASSREIHSLLSLSTQFPLRMNIRDHEMHIRMYSAAVAQLETLRLFKLRNGAQYFMPDSLNPKLDPCTSRSVSDQALRVWIPLSLN